MSDKEYALISSLLPAHEVTMPPRRSRGARVISPSIPSAYPSLFILPRRSPEPVLAKARDWDALPPLLKDPRAKKPFVSGAFVDGGYQGGEA